jgi:hypothetical protein
LSRKPGSQEEAKSQKHFGFFLPSCLPAFLLDPLLLSCPSCLPARSGPAFLPFLPSCSDRSCLPVLPAFLLGLLLASCLLASCTSPCDRYQAHVRDCREAFCLEFPANPVCSSAPSSPEMACDGPQRAAAQQLAQRRCDELAQELGWEAQNRRPR